ncbi:hypothetical protein ONZ45_g5228 [Pleurotus djamor]|nr:hypothetical protein ONZ45_g5228 [Pleurotus djamor]
MPKRRAPKPGDVEPLDNGVSHPTYDPSTKGLAPPVVEKRTFSFYVRRGKKWLKSTPRYRLKKTFDFLMNRGGRRNDPDTIEAMTQVIEDMHDWPADPYSAVYQSAEGRPLLCVFGQTAPPEMGELHDAEEGTGVAGGSYYEYTVGREGHPGRTVDVAPRDVEYDPTIHHDGFLPDEVELAYELAQELHAEMQPVLNERDVRHLDDQGPTHEYTVMDDNGVEIKHCERRGTTHLVHGWHGPGQTHEPLVTSADMMGRHGALRFGEVIRHFALSAANALRLKAYFKITFPEYYALYQEAFEAGVWMRVDPGPWLGKAIVYKLQVTPHVDGQDDGPTACYPTGYFAGGEAYFPDLGIKLAYRPQDIIIFLSGHLYHAVGTWVSTVSPRQSDNLAPGRVGHVHFFHRSALQLLKGKPSGWSARTCGGKYMDTAFELPYEEDSDIDDESASVEEPPRKKRRTVDT